MDTRSLSGEVVVVQPLVLRHHRSRREIALVAQPAGIANSFPDDRVAGNTDECVAQDLGIARGQQRGTDAIINDFRDTTHGRGDDRLVALG